MKKTLLILFAFTGFAIASYAEPPAQASQTKGSSKATANTNSKTSAAPRTVSKEMAQSANGWIYSHGEWNHPEGYKFSNGRVTRTTAHPGKSLPKPPGKLALENPEMFTSPVVIQTDTPSKSKADGKTRNLAPRPAPQTGSHM